MAPPPRVTPEALRCVALPMFEQQYDPRRMGTWEVPDTPDSLPRQRHGNTRFIADDRGHLLEGPARSRQSPWTAFRRTESWEGSRRTTGPHSHSRPGYQNMMKSSQGRQEVRDSRENRPRAAVAAHQTGGQLNPTSGRPEVSAADGSPLDQQLQVTTRSVSCSAGRPRAASRLASPQLSRRPSSEGSPAAGRPVVNSVSPTQLEELRVLERERRSGGSPTPPQSAIRPGEFARALRKENFSHLPMVEPVPEPAVLIEPLPGEPAERTVAIRPLTHPGPTNCSKNVVVRPRTAPAPAEVPAAKPPLLARRPTTALARKVPEIQYALCWSLPLSDSAGSGDSGVQTPRQAWHGPDSRQLTDRLRLLQRELPDSPPPDRLSTRQSPEPTESGYVTPAVGRGCQTPSAVGEARGSPEGPEVGERRRQRLATVLARSLSSLGSSDGQGRPSDRTENPMPDDKTERYECQQRARQTCFKGKAGEQTCDGRWKDQMSYTGRAADRPASDTRHEETPKPSRTSPGDRTASEESVCTCRLRRSASAPDLRGVNVSTQTAGRRRREPDACRLGPGRQLRVRPCRACHLYRRPPHSVPNVKADYRAALRAGCANWRPIVKPYVPQSRRPPPLAVRRPEPPPPHRISTLSPPFAMWNGRRRDEYPARSRLQTTYSLMNRSALQPRRATSFQSLVYQ